MCDENKIVYHLEVDKSSKDILVHLSSLKSKKINHVFKCICFLSAFYMFSIGFFAYLFNRSYAWILVLLSGCFALLGLNAKVFMQVIIKHENEDGKRKYVFSNEGVDIVTQDGVTHSDWRSFIIKGEIENYLYLIQNDKKVILVNKNDLSENELRLFTHFIKDIEFEHIEMDNKMSYKMKTLMVITMLTMMMSIVYIGLKIGYPLEQGEIFRLWFIKTVPTLLLFILLCLNAIWTCVLSGIIKRNNKKSLLKRTLLWIVGVIVLLTMSLGIFVNMLNENSEYYNDNGTVIVKTPVWLDKPSYKLYKEENMLVLEYLRDAHGIEDIDPSITQQNNEITNEQLQLEKTKKIDEGYKKIYQTYIKENDDEYRKDYNAKGHSYIITYEDENQIRYLMFDRDKQDGSKAQYVYYKSNKNSDGSWNMINAEILNIYHYDYKSKEVTDLNKTSW